MRFPKAYKRYIINKVYDFRYGHFKKKISSNVLLRDNANALIAGWLQSKDTFFIGRLGHVECSICWNFSQASFTNTKHSRPLIRSASNNAGISSSGVHSLDRFASIYISAIPYVDLIGLWDPKGMYPLIYKFGSPSLQYTMLGSLEPWRAYLAKQVPWTQSLQGQTVLVVHPFARSIQNQYARRAEVKSIADILPDFHLKTLIPPVTFAQQDNGKPWESNLQSLMNKVANIEFDVAIIGCGAYGFPLGAFVKQLGRKAIHLGGATQLLFGIRGNRWDERDEFNVFMDDSWVRPLLDERPTGADKVEDACYW